MQLQIYEEAPKDNDTKIIVTPEIVPTPYKTFVGIR